MSPIHLSNNKSKLHRSEAEGPSHKELHGNHNIVWPLFANIFAMIENPTV